MSETTPPTPTPELPPTAGGHGFGERLLGALRIDAATYSEIEHDENALPQALGVVALAAVCSGIGAAGGGASGLFWGVVAAVLLWLVSTALVWLVGVRFMGHTSDYPELLRTLGFAQAPQLLLLLAVIPVLGWIVRIAVMFWGLAAYVVAVREALDVETGRAVLVCLIAWGLSVVLSWILMAACVGAGMSASM